MIAVYECRISKDGWLERRCTFAEQETVIRPLHAILPLLAGQRVNVSGGDITSLTIMINMPQVNYINYDLRDRIHQ